MGYNCVSLPILYCVIMLSLFEANNRKAPWSRGQGCFDTGLMYEENDIFSVDGCCVEAT